MEDYYLRRQRGEAVSQQYNRVTILTAQGTHKDLEMDTSVWWDENGRASTHLFLREPSSQAIQDRFTSLLAAFRDADTGMCLLDEQGLVEWANPAMLALAGGPIAAVIGRPLSEVLVIAGGKTALITALQDAAHGKDSQLSFTQPGRELCATKIQLSCLIRRQGERFFLGMVRTEK